MLWIVTGRVEIVTHDGVRIDGRWVRVPADFAGPRLVPGDVAKVECAPAAGGGRPIVERIRLITAARLEAEPEAPATVVGYAR